MKLVCTLEVLNRRAILQGLNPRNKPMKVVIQVIDDGPLGKPIILVSSNQTVVAHQYLVEDVGIIRQDFIHEGKITIEMLEPQIFLMLRNCKEEELKALVEEIRNKKCKRRKIAKDVPEVKAIAKETTAKAKETTTKAKETSAKTIRKDLKNDRKTLVVKRREDYPFNGFPAQLVQLTLTGLILNKVDYRLLDLQNVHVLDLSDNKITSIESLKKLNSKVRRLVLNKNAISNISETFFDCQAMEFLTYLSVNENKLRTLPRSIVKLKYLTHLSASKNRICALPYNIHFLKSLGVLNLSENSLAFLPMPIRMLRLTRLDISFNPLHNQTTPNPIAKVELDRFPTLFELAADAIKTHNYKTKKIENLISTNESELPKIVYDVLEACMLCFDCGNMTSRYTLQLLTTHKSQSLAEEVTSQGTGFVPLKKASCTKCSYLYNLKF